MTVRIGVVTCLWHRHALARLVLRRLAAIRDELAPEGIELSIVAVGSEEEDPGAGDCCIGAGVLYTTAPNSPRAAKWSHGLDRLRELNVDAVVVTGSDDLLEANLFRSWASCLKRGIDLLGIRDTYVIRAGDLRVTHWPGYPEGDPRHGESVGTGRCLSKRLLDALAWRPWHGAGPVGLDGAMWQNIAKHARWATSETYLLGDLDTMLLDVKTEPSVDIGRFEQFEGEEVPAADVLGMLPEAEAAALRELLDPRPAYLKRWHACGGDLPPPRVGLVMIARDAEASIRYALATAAPVVDDMVVFVDSRSTDRTCPIAGEFGSNTVVLDWEGFGSARNEAHAESEATWQLVLDSDESLEPGDLLEAIAEAERIDADAVVVTVINRNSVNQVVPIAQPRVIRAGRARWRWRRHNELVGIKSVVQSTCIIRNSYVGRGEACHAAEVPDLLAMYESPSEPLATPREEKAHAATFLARSYAQMQDWENAKLWARRAHEHAEPGHAYEAMAAFYECWAVLYSEGPDAALPLILRWDVVTGHDCAEFMYLLGAIGWMRYYLRAVNPGRRATIPQNSLAFAGNLPGALAAMGMSMSVREEPAEPGAVEQPGAAT